MPSQRRVKACNFCHIHTCQARLSKSDCWHYAPNLGGKFGPGRNLPHGKILPISSLHGTISSMGSTTTLYIRDAISLIHCVDSRATSLSPNFLASILTEDINPNNATLPFSLATFNTVDVQQFVEIHGLSCHFQKNDRIQHSPMGDDGYGSTGHRSNCTSEA